MDQDQTRNEPPGCRCRTWNNCSSVCPRNSDAFSKRLSPSTATTTLPNPSLTKGQAEALGVKVIQSGEPQHFSMKRSAVEEVLTFPIPPGGKFPQFDQIKVLFLPAPERSLVAAKVAIRNFRLV